MDRETLPDGWHTYNFREFDEMNEDGPIAELRDGYVRVNHFGTFCTKNPLPLAEGDSIYYDAEKGFDYSFEKGKFIEEEKPSSKA